MQPNDTTKRCVKCRADKPLDGYYDHPTCRGGKLHECKACVIARVGRRRAERRSEQVSA